MLDEWYYRSGGEEFGPVPRGGLADLAEAGALRPADEVRHGRDGAWVSAQSIGGLFHGAAAQPAPAETQDALEFAQDLSEFALWSAPQLSSGSHGAAVVASPEPARLAASPSADEWYFQSLGVDMGPVPLSDLLEMASLGTLTAKDLVRQGAEGNWIPASENGRLRQACVAYEREMRATPLPQNRLAPPRSAEPTKSPPAAASSAIASPSKGVPKKVASAKSTKTAAKAATPATPEPRESMLRTEPEPEVKPTVPDATPAPIVKVEATPPGGELPLAAISSPPPVDSKSNTPPSEEVVTFAEAPPPSRPPAPYVPPKPPRKKFEWPRISMPKVDLSGRSAKTLLGLIVAGVLLAAWKYTPSGPGERQLYDQLKGFHTEMAALRERKATDPEWNEFSGRVKEEVKPWVDRLNKTGQAKYPARLELLWAGRDKLPHILDNCRVKPDKVEEEFLRHLQNALDNMEGRTPTAASGPNSPPPQTM